MPDDLPKPYGHARAEAKTPYVTSAVGLEETAGRLRSRRNSVFAHTIIWVTVLLCLAFLLGSLAQALSNSQLARELQYQQQEAQRLQNQHIKLTQEAGYYNDPYVIEGEARQQSDYGHPDEHIIIVAIPDNQDQQKGSAATKNAQPGNFWSAWWKLFFGNE